MKKIYLSLLLGLIFLVSGNAKNIELRPDDGFKITITIEIGRKPECTMAWAFCRISVGGLGLTATGEILPTGEGSGGGGGRSWKIAIPRENFAKYYPNFLVKLDGKSTVTFEDTYILPSEIQKALGSTTVLVIQGNVAYPLKYENGEYVMTFPL